MRICNVIAATVLLFSLIAWPAAGQQNIVVQDNFKAGQSGENWRGGGGIVTPSGAVGTKGQLFGQYCRSSGYSVDSAGMSRRPVRVEPGRYRIVVRFFSPRAYSRNAERQSIQLGVNLSLLGAKSFKTKAKEISGYLAGCKIYEVDEVFDIQSGGDLSVGLRFENADQRIGGKTLYVTEVVVFALDRVPQPRLQQELVRLPEAGPACRTAEYVWSCANSQRLADRGTSRRPCGGIDQRRCCNEALTHRRNFCAAKGIERFECACVTTVRVGEPRDPAGKPKRDTSDLTDKVTAEASDFLDDARDFEDKWRELVLRARAGQLDSPVEFTAAAIEREQLSERYSAILNSINEERSKLFDRSRRAEQMRDAAKQSQGPGAADTARRYDAEVRLYADKLRQLDQATQAAREGEMLIPRE